MKSVRFTVSAARDLKRHSNMADRARKAIADYAVDSLLHANNIKQLAGSSARRLRIGDFRLIFEETETDILVTKFAPRGGVYE